MYTLYYITSPTEFLIGDWKGTDETHQLFSPVYNPSRNLIHMIRFRYCLHHCCFVKNGKPATYLHYFLARNHLYRCSITKSPHVLH